MKTITERTDNNKTYNISLKNLHNAVVSVAGAHWAKPPQSDQHALPYSCVRNCLGSHCRTH